ncbi:DMT family transporter [Kitasatospora kifunensis]|uniref:Drug/metabolite transporter (DMT)-like permease n=1 Tax=Kitasatospora kifunensis TaxID=58351 RepID=A0A7W7QWG7_KITKI|nr:DMT family transporter [Kitasatospora kifunensis]MBB4921070.1 drug/metabolite transporter (DMT)-like permease [Kitasatospora kifunensis]
MAIVLTVLFAVLAAVSNACAMVLQRTAARTVPQSDAFSLRLMRDLLRHPAWLGGMATVICAAVFQALALAMGSLALVQPIFVTELTFVLLIACAAFRRRLPPLGWFGIIAVTVGIALALVAAAPSGGRDHAPLAVWILTLIAGGGAMACCVLAALPYGRGKARAALFGTAAAIGYALTAALLKSAADTAEHGVAAFFTSWQTYGFATVGVCSLFLLSNAVESGPLLASQPALTLGDAVVSLTLGILVYGEHVRTGWWLVPEAVGALLVVAGVMVLPRVETQALGPRPGAS